MIDYLQSALTGLGGGAAIALLALGLVLAFRASGVVNLAHAAMGMYVAYVFFTLRDFDHADAKSLGGNLVLPFLGLPARVHVFDRPSAFTAFVIALVVAAVLGALLYALVFRPLRHAPALARVVASLGLFLYFQQIAQLRFVGSGGGATSFRLESVLPEGSVSIGHATVPIDRFWLAGIAVVAATVLSAVFAFTRFGLATRAAASDEKGAIFTGVSPDVAGVWNWALATVIAGAAMILVEGVEQALEPTTTSLRVVPALAAALLGGLDSFAVATGAGLGIGALAAALQTFQARADWLPDWLPRGALRDALPVLLILVAITVRGDRIPARDTFVDRRLPLAPTPRRVLPTTLLLSTVAIVAVVTGAASLRQAVVVSATAALIGLSVVVLTGWVGQISLAHYAFAGLAAFTTAKLTTDLDVPFPWAPLLAIVLTVVVGLVASSPATRVRGMTLGVATIGIAVAIQALAFNSPAFSGMPAIPAPRLFGFDLSWSGTHGDDFRPAFGVATVLVLALAVLAVTNMRRAATGMRWLAVRSNERAAAAAGIDVGAVKSMAFGLSSLLAAIGGVLLSYQLSTLQPLSFSVVSAISLLALCYLGSIGSVWGALVAGVVTSGGLMSLASETSEYQFAVSGILLVVVAIAAPDGLVASAQRGVARLARSRA